jgi:hypothetical protein
MVFANFMLCSFAGGSIYHLTTRGALSARFELRPYHMLSGALAIALIGEIRGQADNSGEIRVMILLLYVLWLATSRQACLQPGSGAHRAILIFKLL